MFHACQRDAGIAFPDMVKSYLCLHRCDQRAVVLGRAIAPALRSCFLEYRVPKLSRRSHGVFVSEMPHETEEEEERDEEDGGDDLDDVDKCVSEDDESDMVLEEGPRGAGVCVETEATRNLKGETASRIWTTVEISSKPCNAEVSRRS